MRAIAAPLLAAMLIPLLSGCALVPKANGRLEEARLAIDHVRRDADVGRHAPLELGKATAALQRAVDAWNTLEDPALVDHLAYVAKQRAAIARAVAERANLQEQALQR